MVELAVRKLFISADMEGCPAVSSQQALLPDRWSWEWSAARQWMTDQVIAVAESAFALHYTEVIVADGHGNGHNIDPDRLPDDVRLIRSWPRPLIQMQGAEDPLVDACVFIGYHAGAETANSILAHSFSGAAYRSITLNGEPCSEGYLNAALAGEFGKPVIFISGDEHTVADARRYAPASTYLVAKHSIGWRAQSSLPPGQVCKLLKQSVTSALSKTFPPPFVLYPPFVLELEMTTPVAAEMLTYLPNVRRKGPYGITTTFNSISTVMSFLSFAMLYTPTGTPAL